MSACMAPPTTAATCQDMFSARPSMPSPASRLPWTDLTSNPVVNASEPFNAFGFDISSIAIDPHDATDNTLYATVEGMAVFGDEVRIIYRTTDGGATWTDITANLPLAPASSVVVDPQSANTVYIATDAGVFFTTEVANCAKSLLNCWSEFGIGLPGAPVVALSATPLTVSPRDAGGCHLWARHLADSALHFGHCDHGCRGGPVERRLLANTRSRRRQPACPGSALQYRQSST